MSITDVKFVQANIYKEKFHASLNNQKQTAQTAEQKQKTEEKTTQVVQPAPKVLSKVEIAPERGFMCVSYKENINLIGYIFEDVFPLYNFKRTKLNNYDIKFRLTEKDEKSANFIVRVDDTKMVVKATKQKMNVEIVL